MTSAPLSHISFNRILRSAPLGREDKRNAESAMTPAPSTGSITLSSWKDFCQDTLTLPMLTSAHLINLCNLCASDKRTSNETLPDADKAFPPVETEVAFQARVSHVDVLRLLWRAALCACGTLKRVS